MIVAIGVDHAGAPLHAAIVEVAGRPRPRGRSTSARATTTRTSRSPSGRAVASGAGRARRADLRLGRRRRRRGVEDPGHPRADDPRRLHRPPGASSTTPSNVLCLGARVIGDAGRARARRDFAAARGQRRAAPRAPPRQGGRARARRARRGPRRHHDGGVTMQLGMIGLGRMGANMVRRLMRGRPRVRASGTRTRRRRAAARRRGRDRRATRRPTSSPSSPRRAPSG